MIIHTTLCYLIREDSYLMMHRTKKEKDINRDKWIGVGGKVEAGESPEDCVIREVAEETGYQLQTWAFRGIVTFCYAEVTEYMYLFTSDAFEAVSAKGCGTDWDCDEGDLVWVPRAQVYDLPIWEGDKIFFKLLEERETFFSLKLVYDRNERLTEVALDGRNTPIAIACRGENQYNIK